MKLTAPKVEQADVDVCPQLGKSHLNKTPKLIMYGGTNRALRKVASQSR
jgi:hypothetical protein